jgi:hypothetical protein
MPLIQTLSYTNQNVATGKSVVFTLSPASYDMVSLRVWLYDLAAASSAKVASGTITRAGSGIASRFNINPTLTTSVTSVCLQSDYFSLSAGDVVQFNIVGGAGDTANVDIIAELWGIPDISAQITTVDTVVDSINARLPSDPADESLLETYISSETAGLATSVALGVTSSVVNSIDSRLPADPAAASDVVSYVAVTAANAATLAAGNVAFLSYAHTSQVITSTSTEDLSSATKVWFALKDSYQETDAQSLIFIEKTAGLTHVGKSAIVSPIVTTDGSLTVGGSSGAWTFTVVLKSEAAAYLADYAGSGKLGEVKATIGGLDIVIGTVTGAINSGVIRTNA